MSKMYECDINMESAFTYTNVGQLSALSVAEAKPGCICELVKEKGRSGSI